MQSLTNNWLVASNITWGIWWIFTKPLKILTISFQWVLYDKVYKVLATKMQRSYFSWHQTVIQHVKKPWPCGLKNDIRNWMSTQNSETLYLHLDGFFLFSKAYNAPVRKFHSNYVCRHWRVMQFKKKKRLMAGKIAWQIWLTFMETVDNPKVCSLMGFFQSI